MASQASTYAPNDALTFAKRFVKGTLVDASTVGPQICDAAARMLWMAAPWSWTVGVLPIATLAADTQTYNVTDPTDLLRLEWAGWSRANDRMEELAIVSVVPTDTAYNQPPKKIAISAITGGNVTLKLWPCPASIEGRIFTLYKKVMTKIVTGNISSAVLVFPDEFFHVYEEAVLYWAFKFSQDVRAGEAVWKPDGSFQFTGQLAVVMALVEAYRKNEPTMQNTLGFEPRKE